ncbi:MAG: hypothetical protein BMS9Abin03_343 [Thermodesulfobacteriota bacterium]|nr:MAG: hypothetical protein BMS9Abin03_343 [Thermodesulfobacteriota bacterium]
MPKIARLDAPRVLHHVIGRGIERRKIFLSDTDRNDFIGAIIFRRKSMRQITLKWFYLTMLSVVLIIACAGTKLTHTWVDETHRGKLVSNILVIGVTYKEKEAVRLSFEDNFVTQLRAAGVEAVAVGDAISIPKDLELEKDEILKAVNKFNNDAVIITHLVGKEEKESYTRPERLSGGFYGYHGRAHGYIQSPGYSRTSTTVRLITNLYDVKTEKLIWSGESESLDPDSIKQMIDDVIKVVIKDLQKKNLLPQK